MPINNEGKFSLSEVVRRQIDRDWPAANTNFDLFVQDLIASGNVIANGLIIRNIEVSDNILTGNISAATITANTLTLDIITANVFNGISLSIDDLTDVDTTSSPPLDKQALVYDEATGVWIPGIDLAVGLPQFGSLTPTNTTSSFYHSIQSTTLTNDFALSFWLYIPSNIPNGSYGLFEKTAFNVDNSQLSSFVQITGGLAYIYVRNNPSNLSINMFRSFSIASSGWHYITYSYDQSAGIFYLGADGSVTNDQSFNVDWTGGDLNVYFGYRAGGGFTSGTSTLLKFADVGLRTTLDYATNFTPPTSHPTASDYYFLSLAKTSADKLVDSGTSGSNFVEFGSGTTFNSDNPFPASGNLTVAGFIIGDLIGTVSSISNHDTDDLIAGSNNLYFTNTRAILSVFPATTQLVVFTPVFNYNMDQYSGDNPTIYVTAGETISFELKHSSSHPFNIRVSAGGSAYNTGLTHVDTDGTISSGAAAQGKYTGKLFWKIPYELAGNTYVYQCTNHGGMVGDIVIQGSILDTITNADLTLNNLTVNGDFVVQGNTTTLNTATLTIEDKNIVLANGAVDAAAADGAGITINGAGANITYRESGDKIEINKTLDILGDLTVTGNISGNGLIIRGVEVSDAVLSGNVTAEGGITGNTLVVDSITANTWNNIYTANVVETAGNLYFTVQRARDSFTAGQNITIVDGEIAAEAQFLTVINDSTTITAAAGNLTYGMDRSINDSRNILVIVEGLIQIPQTDYTVDGTNISFADQPPPGANIEIRFFGAEGSSGSRPTLISTVNSFIGTGNVAYALTQSPSGKSYVTVVIDGVTQQNDAYNVSGTVLTFTEAPAVGANVDIRIIAGQVGAPFNTRTFVGDGANTAFAISTNFNQDQILVFENGVAQTPGTDYSVAAGNVIFNTAPAANVGIHIRELASSGANLLNTISGLNQTTGSLVPDVDGVRSLGTAVNRYKDLFLTGNTIVLGDIALSTVNGLLQIAPVVAGNVITANAAPSSFTAGDNITIEANGRISSTATGTTTGKAIAMAIVFGG